MQRSMEPENESEPCPTEAANAVIAKTHFAADGTPSIVRCDFNGGLAWQFLVGRRQTPLDEDRLNHWNSRAYRRRIEACRGEATQDRRGVVDEETRFAMDERV
jgi:hypothetical protein